MMEFISTSSTELLFFIFGFIPSLVVAIISGYVVAYYEDKIALTDKELVYLDISSRIHLLSWVFVTMASMMLLLFLVINLYPLPSGVR